MKTPNILTKMDTIYTNITEKIIGNMPLDTQIKKNQIDEKETRSSKITDKLKQVRDLARNGISRIKKVGIKNAVLTLGTSKNDDLLYDNVVKRETNKIATGVEKEEPAKEKIEKKPSTNKNESSSIQKLKETVKNKAKVESIDKKSTTEMVKNTRKKKPKAPNVTGKEEATKKETKKKTTVSKKDDLLTKTVKNTNKKKTKLSDESTVSKGDSKKSTHKKPKKTAKVKISKREEKMALYAKDITKHYGEVDELFLALIVKNLGPSIYRANAELVSCSEPKELDTVRKNFLIKKLGIDASKPILDASIQDVCEELKGAQRKYRATFYYRLAKKFKKESELS